MVLNFKSKLWNRKYCNFILKIRLKDIGNICIEMDGGMIGVFDFLCVCLYFSVFFFILVYIYWIYSIYIWYFILKFFEGSIIIIFMIKDLEIRIRGVIC